MDRDAEDEASGLQRRQQATAAMLHDQLRKLIPLIPAMKLDEVKQLVEAIDSTLWLEYKAAIVDKRIELDLKKVSAD